MAISISGNVKDSQDSPLAEIVVKAIHEPTGSTFAKKTDSQGWYVFNRLNAGGSYVLSVTLEGYVSAEITGIHLKTEESLVHNFYLERQS